MKQTKWEKRFEKKFLIKHNGRLIWNNTSGWGKPEPGRVKSFIKREIKRTIGKDEDLTIDVNNLTGTYKHRFLKYLGVRNDLRKEQLGLIRMELKILGEGKYYNELRLLEEKLNKKGCD